MNDISLELARLHTLTGADFSRQVERIALMGVFHPIEDETSIYTVGIGKCDDLDNIIAAARKAVEFGYRVYILPNPKEIRTADFIFDAQEGRFFLCTYRALREKIYVR